LSSVSFTTTGEIIPSSVEGTKKMAVVSSRILSIRVVCRGAAPIRSVSGAMVSAPSPDRKRSQPSVEGRGYRSARIPPIHAPMLMPARTTPMMLVHVYRETPT